MYLFLDRKIRILLIAMIVIFAAMAFSGPAEVLDIHLYYTGDQARTFFANLSAEQIQSYIITALLDLCFIAFYTAALVRSLRISFDHRFSFLGLAPGIFDLIETIGILRALWTSEFASYFDFLGVITFLKWISGFSLLVILILTPRRFRKLSPHLQSVERN